jgi:hypothetical protein
MPRLYSSEARRPMQPSVARAQILPPPAPTHELHAYARGTGSRTVVVHRDGYQHSCPKISPGQERHEDHRHCWRGEGCSLSHPPSACRRQTARPNSVDPCQWLPLESVAEWGSSRGRAQLTALASEPPPLLLLVPPAERAGRQSTTARAGVSKPIHT